MQVDTPTGILSPLRHWRRWTFRWMLPVAVLLTVGASGYAYGSGAYRVFLPTPTLVCGEQASLGYPEQIMGTPVSVSAAGNLAIITFEDGYTVSLDAPPAFYLGKRGVFWRMTVSPGDPTQNIPPEMGPVVYEREPAWTPC
jgi:hypothetical protein